MADISFIHNIDLNGNSLKNLSIDKLISDPTQPLPFQIWSNTTQNKIKYFDGTNVRTITTDADLAAHTMLASQITDFNNAVQSNTTVQSNVTRLGILETRIIKATWFEIITTTTGTITKPTNSTILLDQFDGATDAIVSLIDPVSSTPTFEKALDSVGNPVLVSSFDAVGNYSLSAVPTTTPFCIVYVYETQILNFDRTLSIGFELTMPSAVEIEALYESLPNTNKFTDLEKIAVSKIENNQRLILKPTLSQDLNTILGVTIDFTTIIENTIPGATVSLLGVVSLPIGTYKMWYKVNSGLLPDGTRKSIMVVMKKNSLIFIDEATSYGYSRKITEPFVTNSSPMLYLPQFVLTVPATFELVGLRVSSVGLSSSIPLESIWTIQKIN